ncbi:MAG: 2-dehydropantoate 2-reductase [Paraglaciecola sp.]|nr:2-dehydropantoate 2-reductase [Paraglaciecola sp.]NCT49093.1 2-dehydropantoate 2-reductase [Paraglaciecola sp.]
MKLAIVGHGAIGNLLAYRCQLHKIEFEVLSRQTSRSVLIVSDPDKGLSRFTLSSKALAQGSEADLIVVPVKAYQVASVIHTIKPWVQPAQTIMLLHNGMGTIDLVRHALPDNNLLAATTTYGAYKSSDNALQIKGLGATQCGWIYQQPSCNNKAIENAISCLLPPVTFHSNIQLALWRKLAVNASINPLSAIHQVQNGALKRPEYHIIIEQVCDEIMRLMQALGLPSNTQDLLAEINTVIDKTADNYSSMNRDVAAKRPSEIHFINGYIVSQAQQYGIPCPTNLRLFNSICDIEKAYLSL